MHVIPFVSVDYKPTAGEVEMALGQAGLGSPSMVIEQFETSSPAYELT